MATKPGCISPEDVARIAVVCSQGTEDVFAPEVGDLDEAVLDRAWVGALDLCKKELNQSSKTGFDRYDYK